MGRASNRNQHGFTLVEISIVMIIIGLLIGGTFGGMKLIENMQVNKTVQDLKAIDSAALTFRDTYGRLPGDIRNPSTRLPNCTVAPCATGGNGNRVIEFTSWSDAVTTTDERFTFWAHLQAADLLSMATKNVLDLNFGEGQPESPVGGGYRLAGHNGALFVAGSTAFRGTGILIGVTDSATITGGTQFILPCTKAASIDRKIDDGLVVNGYLQSWYCGASTLTDSYSYINNDGASWYDTKGY